MGILYTKTICPDMEKNPIPASTLATYYYAYLLQMLKVRISPALKHIWLF